MKQLIYINSKKAVNENKPSGKNATTKFADLMSAAAFVDEETFMNWASTIETKEVAQAAWNKVHSKK